MAFGMKNLYIIIIDNSNIGAESGCMPGKYGRFYRNGMANATDTVHLGRLGLRLFSKNIKGSIIGKGKTNLKRDSDVVMEITGVLWGEIGGVASTQDDLHQF